MINSCNCTKCKTESLFIEFHYKGSAYNVGGVYRHPNGKVPHFITDLETVLNKTDSGKTTVLAGDMNIDIIKLSNEDVVSYMTTLMSYRFLPYVTLPSRITNFSMTCIDHIFIRLSHKDKAVNMISGLFYCEISDHLLCFISIKYNRQCNAGERPLIRLFDEKNSAVFVQKWKPKIGMIFIRIPRIIIINFSLQWYIYSSSHSLLSGCLGNAGMISHGWQQR